MLCKYKFYYRVLINNTAHPSPPQQAKQFVWLSHALGIHKARCMLVFSVVRDTTNELMEAPRGHSFL